jgi:hypothetical protein
MSGWDAPPREIVPGVVHWTTFHDGIDEPVSSYFVVDGGVLLDPRVPEGGFEALAERFGEPRAVVLTNRHHYRHAGQVVERWGATVHCHASGLYEFTPEQQVQGFATRSSANHPTLRRASCRTSSSATTPRP